MKKSIYFLAFLLPFAFTSCEAVRITRSPQEVKTLTSRQFESSKDVVFKSAISLIQSESYLIEDANEKTGLTQLANHNPQTSDVQAYAILFFTIGGQLLFS